MRPENREQTDRAWVAGFAWGILTMVIGLEVGLIFTGRLLGLDNASWGLVVSILAGIMAFIAVKMVYQILFRPKSSGVIL